MDVAAPGAQPSVAVVHHRSPSRWGARDEGQALVELALVMMVCLLLLVGIVDVGRAAVVAVAVQGGAGAAARLGAQRLQISGITDQVIMQRLIASSYPFLDGCTAAASSPTLCSPSYGGSWTLSVSYGATEGSSIDVKAVGVIPPVANLSQLAASVGLGQIDVSADAQTIVL